MTWQTWGLLGSLGEGPAGPWGHQVTFPLRLQEEGEGWCSDCLCYYPWRGNGGSILTFLCLS